MTYYKAIRPDGTDFHSGTVQWAPVQGGIPAEGLVVTHPTSTEWGNYHSTHLCASTSPTGCTGFKWPCRLLEVEPVSEVHEHGGCKVSALSWRVLRELPAMQALGPQGAAVAALIDGLRRLGAEALARLADAWSAWDAARDAAWAAAWNAAWDAAVALVMWDLIAPAHRDALTEPIRTALSDLWADVTVHLPLEKELDR